MHVDPTDTTTRKATFTLNTFPRDKGSAGIKGCALSGGQYTNQALEQNIPLNLEFTTEAPHLLEITCEDTVGNKSTTQIKFPPIVTFSAANQTLKKEYKSDEEFNFSVYSPSSTPIKDIAIE